MKKCNKYKEWILLEESGEIQSSHLQELKIHLSECSECTNFKEELTELTGIVKKYIKPVSPSSYLISQILNSVSAHRSRWRIKFLWLPAICVTMAILLFIIYLPCKFSKTPHPFETPIGILLTIEDGNFHDIAYAETKEKEIEILAKKLLRLQCGEFIDLDEIGLYAQNEF